MSENIYREATGADAINEHLTPIASAPVTTLFLHFSTKERVLFAKRLAFLTKSGISILESLIIIRNQTKPAQKKKIYANIIADLSAGHSLSRSLTPYTPLFGIFTINLIKAGELAGTLPENLTYLSNELEKRESLERKVKSALVYPLFITISTLVVTGGLIMFIFPKVLPILISLNVELPWTTKILLVIGEFLSEHGSITVFGLCIFFITVESLRRSVPAVHYAADWLLLHLPIVKPLVETYNSAQFSRTLSLSLKSGITLKQSLDTATETTHNLIYKNIFQKLSTHVTEGKRISSMLYPHSHLFPAMFPELIAIGETTGNLSNTLEHLSHHYESELDDMTKNLSHALEPFLLLCMGILVGTVAISVIAPIYEVTKHIGTLR